MSSIDISHKLCLITGANSGLGKATAQKLAEKGAYILMLCRNERKGEEVQKEIIRETGNCGVELLIANLEHSYDIRMAAETVKERFDKLDILINNAGIYPAGRKETVEGVERTFAINHLAPFLLTNLLLEPLKASDYARVITVSSETHWSAASHFDLNNLQLRKGFSPLKAYSLSKLCNIMFTHELARRTAGTSITANALHPGTVKTALSDGASWPMKLYFTLGKPFMRTPAKGAETTVYLATSDEVSDISGRYFKNKKQEKAASIAYNDELTKRLWEISRDLTRL